MAKLVSSAGSAVLLCALLAGCAASPVHTVGLYSSPEPIHPTCDTSVRYIELLGRVGNAYGEKIAFRLDDFRGPPFDPAHMAYRVYASAPGEELQLVHNSANDSEWERTLRIARADSAMFHIPIFGLRPADYHHYFRVEFRDSRNRSYWTPEFTLCAVTPANCACPGVVATAAGANAPQKSCAAAPPSILAQADAPGGISLVCR